MRTRPSCGNRARLLLMTDGLEPGANRELIKHFQWQVDERADPVLQVLEGSHKCLFLVGLGPLNSRWVFDAPVGDGGMSWPNGAGFTCRAVTNREHKVHDGGSRCRKLVPGFRAVAVCRIAMGLQHLQRERVDCAFRL